MHLPAAQVVGVHRPGTHVRPSPSSPRGQWPQEAPFDVSVHCTPAQELLRFTYTRIYQIKTIQKSIWYNALPEKQGLLLHGTLGTIVHTFPSPVVPEGHGPHTTPNCDSWHCTPTQVKLMYKPMWTYYYVVIVCLSKYIMDYYKHNVMFAIKTL